VINFFDWTEEKAKEYSNCYDIVERLVKPERMKIDDSKNNTNKNRKNNWWLYGSDAKNLYRAIAPMERVLVHTRVTKTHAFSYHDSDTVFSDQTVLFTVPYFPILQSNLHEHWAWNYSSSMKGDRRYNSTGCFETFPFSQNLSPEREKQLETIGEAYHEHRRRLMLGIQLGLTKTCNLFHSHAITAARVDNKDKTIQQLMRHLEKNGDTISLEEALTGIIKLRELHVKMDNTVLEAYGWKDVALNHDFYEVDYLPENDRIRYTISPEARKEILKRLLELNHAIHEQEEKDGLLEKTKKRSKTKRKNDFPEQKQLFGS